MALVCVDKSVEEDRKKLEDLITDPEFERLERQVGRFNLFAAVGVANQELRHSDFLRFLMDPKQPHGLADGFLKGFIRKALLGAGLRPEVSILEIDCWDFNQAQVYRERNNIDLLVVIEAHRLIVLIENKVFAGEGGNQLHRYLETVRERYSGWRVVPIFLSPKGVAPSHADYFSCSYAQLIELVEKTLDAHGDGIGVEVRMAMRHYAEMVRRRILNRSELDALCVRLYHRHEPALKLILQRGQGLQPQLREWLEELIREDQGTPELVFDFSNTQWISFLPSEWDIPSLRAGNYSNFGDLKRVLLFWFANNGKSLNLELQVSPTNKALQQALEVGVQTSDSRLRWRHKRAGWYVLYEAEWLTAEDFSNLEMEEIREKVRQRWQDFKDDDLQWISGALKVDDWLE